MFVFLSWSREGHLLETTLSVMFVYQRYGVLFTLQTIIFYTITTFPKIEHPENNGGCLHHTTIGILCDKEHFKHGPLTLTVPNNFLLLYLEEDNAVFLPVKISFTVASLSDRWSLWLSLLFRHTQWTMRKHTIERTH